VGYTRELAPGAGTDNDTAHLTAEGVERVFADAWSGDTKARPRLAECLEVVHSGDVVVVTSAAMLAPTVAQFVSTVAALAERGIGFHSLTEPELSSGRSVDPTEVLVALEGLRRRLTSLQTRAGMASAATEGRRPGRPTVMTPDRVAMALELRALGRPVTHIARVLGVSANAVQRALAAADSVS
jgi:DNA invertase Pin-like site-specific DNA recombinase